MERKGGPGGPGGRGLNGPRTEPPGRSSGGEKGHRWGGLGTLQVFKKWKRAQKKERAREERRAVSEGRKSLEEVR